MHLFHPSLRGVFCLLIIGLLQQTALACSVPVFRYGLEHWQADPYRVFIVHRGALSPEAEGLVKSLKDSATRANVSVQSADLARDPGSDAQAAWEAAGSPQETSLIVQAPNSARVAGIVWSGPLNKANVTALLDSPARRAIATRLGEGETAVFALLESGDKAADDAAASLLDARLSYLASVLELPKLDDQDIRNGLVSVPPDGLRLSFSVLRISRGDPSEHVFTQMLLATEPDLKQSSGPIAFPIFGQGRALYALVGKGIKHETIDEAASFLIGSCSCQVKEKNPGADLLMAVDWKALLKDQATGLADLPPASEIVGGKMEAVTIAPQVHTEAPSPPQRIFIAVPETANPRAVIIGALVIGCLVATVAVVLFRKRKP
jgi:hypothetical protein